MRWFFTYFGINGTLLNAWDKQTIYNQQRMSLDGVCDATWGWGWIGPNGEHFLSWSWYQHTLIRTTVLPVNDPILLNGGKKGLTQQSTGIGERFFISGWWSPINVAAYNTRFGYIFLSQNQLIWMEIDEGGVIEQTTINKRTHIMDMINEKGSKCLLQWLAVPRLHNPNYH